MADLTASRLVDAWLAGHRGQVTGVTASAKAERERMFGADSDVGRGHPRTGAVSTRTRSHEEAERDATDERQPKRGGVHYPGAGSPAPQTAGDYLERARTLLGGRSPGEGGNEMGADRPYGSVNTYTPTAYRSPGPAGRPQRPVPAALARYRAMRGWD
jgi:hypothetical protein